MRACSVRAVVNVRAREHALVRVYRARKHPWAREGCGGGVGKPSLKTSAIASNAVIVRVREAPCATGRSSKGQLQQQRVM
jgi:hypothetical protein